MEMLFQKDGNLEMNTRSFGMLLMSEACNPVVVEPLQPTNRDTCVAAVKKINEFVPAGRQTMLETLPVVCAQVRPTPALKP
eukprot:9486779-Pyramimonas_sp.AAC.2